MKEKNMDEKRKNNKFIPILILLFGIILILYPIISGLLSKYNQTHVISNYRKEMQVYTKEDISEKNELIENYNSEISNSESSDEENNEENISYIDLISIEDVLGYIEIEKIDVNLPIYEGVSEEVLKVGAGHIPKTTLPSEAPNTHAIFTAHRGLPTATLFTNLNKLEENDEFSIVMLDKKYNYKVDKIETVLPEDVVGLSIVEGKNYATLITCTPYMINSHRLLVRGEFVSVEDVEEVVDVMNVEDTVYTGKVNYIDFCTILIILLFIIIVIISRKMFLILISKEKKEKKDKKR